MKLLSHRKQFVIIFALTLLAGVGAQSQTRFVTSKNSGQAGTPYVDQQVIVKLDDSVNAIATAAVRSSMNAKMLKRFSSIGAELWQISEGTVEAAIARYRQDPRIKYIEPNYRVYLFDQRIERFPNDPRFLQLWGLHNTGQTGGTADADIDAPEAWDIETGKDVLIGIIDTGVDYNHQDLVNNIWTNPGEIPGNNMDDDGNGYVDDVHGYDFVNDDDDPFDDNEHGTHVAGTIAAMGNNGIGVVGVSWSAKIMALKFLDAGGSGTTAGAILAVEYATRMRARLTNNSWGGGGFSQALRDAIEASGNAGILFVAAAGNDAKDNDLDPHYPSSYDLDNIVAVAATDHRDQLGQCSFSNWGATSVDLGAPGDNILSTTPGNTYSTFCGTSMATPHVSGAISLVWSRVPGLSSLQVKELILKAVDPIPSLQGRTVSGGRLNVFNALILAEPDSIAPAAVTDLATVDPKSNFITLAWTASGDDGDSGKAATYDIRYSTSPINSANFAAATKVSGAPAPKPAGDPESFAVSRLNFNTTYYFALKVIDEQGNASEVSNSPSGTTLGIPIIAATPDSLADSLLTGAQSTKTLIIANNGEGTLDFNITIEGVSTPALAVKAYSPQLNADRRELKDSGRREAHSAEYTAYKTSSAQAGLSSPAQPVANPNTLE
ncbi:MAG: S8 family serine peptidase, partial [bacterium]